MAVFMINICKYNSCGITFPSLGELIQHIEDKHIDYDPVVVEQKEASQPTCIPLSYILRFFTESSRREFQNSQNAAEARRRQLPVSKTPSVVSSTPTGSEFDEEDMSPSEDSNDSWTTIEEYSSEYILRHGSRIQQQGINNMPAIEKPFACPVPGCKKRYKNVNGIKYHSKNGHKKNGKVKKGFRCHCGKSYKTAQGLKNHSLSRHGLSTPTVFDDAPAINNTMPSPISVTRNMPNLVVTASQPIHGPLNIIEGMDGHKLIRYYDVIKQKETVTAYPIQKHTLNNLTIISRNVDSSGQIVKNVGVATQNLAHGIPIESNVYTKETTAVKVSVQSNQISPLMPNYANDNLYSVPNM